jgi:hypothetical protein
MTGTDAALLNQVGDLAGDDTGFATAGPGQYQQWAINVIYCSTLLGIEFVQVGLPVLEDDQ